MNDKQATAREYVDSSFEDGLRAIDDIVGLLPHAGLGPAPRLDNDISKARALLTNARQIAVDLAAQMDAMKTDD